MYAAANLTEEIQHDAVHYGIDVQIGKGGEVSQYVHYNNYPTPHCKKCSTLQFKIQWWGFGHICTESYLEKRILIDRNVFNEKKRNLISSPDTKLKFN